MSRTARRLTSDVRQRDPQCRLNVDSGRPRRGHSAGRRGEGHLLLAAFLLARPIVCACWRSERSPASLSNSANLRLGRDGLRVNQCSVSVRPQCSRWASRSPDLMSPKPKAS